MSQPGELAPTLPLLPVVRLRHLRHDCGVLHPTGVAFDEDVLGLNLTRGCTLGCAFCSVRASPGFPGDDELILYERTAERLAEELDARPQLPRAVFVSPATDPFPPLEEVQAATVAVVETLAVRGVQTWLMTRGQISASALEALARRRDHVRVTIALTTLEEAWRRELEPGTASAPERLAQLARLHELGVPAHATLDPLLPGLTDRPDNLRAVLKALAAAGVRQITAGYLFLREAIVANLRPVLNRLGVTKTVLGAYVRGPVLTGPGLAAARYLSRTRRQRGYATIMALAVEHGIKVSVSGLTNPDFAPPRPTETPAERPRLLSQFLHGTKVGP
jgi:DNA repair photolyase